MTSPNTLGNLRRLVLGQMRGIHVLLSCRINVFKTLVLPAPSGPSDVTMYLSLYAAPSHAFSLVQKPTWDLIKQQVRPSRPNLLMFGFAAPVHAFFWN